MPFALLKLYNHDKCNFFKYGYLLFVDIFNIFMENILLLSFIFENWKIFKRLKKYA